MIINNTHVNAQHISLIVLHISLLRGLYLVLLPEHATCEFKDLTGQDV